MTDLQKEVQQAIEDLDDWWNMDPLSIEAAIHLRDLLQEQDELIKELEEKCK